MHTGQLKFYNFDRGYGFIRNDMGADDFVHASQLQLSGINPAVLQDGKSRFSYEVGTGKNGKTQATDLQLID